jgi:hypothetical protein
MTNKELIEILSKLPMDAEIMVANYDNDTTDYFDRIDDVLPLEEEGIIFADDGFKDKGDLRYHYVNLKSIILNYR